MTDLQGVPYQAFVGDHFDCDEFVRAVLEEQMAKMTDDELAAMRARMDQVGRDVRDLINVMERIINKPITLDGKVIGNEATD